MTPKPKKTKPKKSKKEEEFEDLELEEDDFEEEDYEEDEYEEDFEEEDYEEDDMPKKTKRKSGGGKAKAVILSLLIGLIVGAGLTFYFTEQKQKIQKNEAQDEQTTLDNRSVEEKVQSLLRPELKDKPVLAQVKDISLIEKYPQYQFAKNGDKVLVYKEMTIIYDEELNKIVSAVPQNVLKETVELEDKEMSDEQTKDKEDEEGTDSADESDGTDEEDADESDEAITAEISIEVRNGTESYGLAGKTAKEITDELGYTTKATNASNSDYTKTVIVDLSKGAYPNEVEDLRDHLEVTEVLNSLPDGEEDSNSDIVVILGG